MDITVLLCPYYYYYYYYHHHHYYYYYVVKGLIRARGEEQKLGLVEETIPYPGSAEHRETRSCRPDRPERGS